MTLTPRGTALVLLVTMLTGACSGGGDDVQDATLAAAEARTERLVAEAAKAVAPDGGPYRPTRQGPLPCSDTSTVDVEGIPEFDVKVGDAATLDDARAHFEERGWSVEERPVRTLVARVDDDYSVTAEVDTNGVLFLTATGPCRPVAGSD